MMSWRSIPPLIFHYADQCKGTARFLASNGGHSLARCTGNTHCVTVNSENELALHNTANKHAVFYDDAKKIAGIRVAASTKRTPLGLYPGSNSVGEGLVKLTCVSRFDFKPVALATGRGNLGLARYEPNGQVTVAGWACEGGRTGAREVQVETLMEPCLTRQPLQMLQQNRVCMIAVESATHQRSVDSTTRSLLHHHGQVSLL